MQIAISLGGRAENISDAGKIVVNDFHSDDWSNGSGCEINNHSDVGWEFEIAAGSVKTFTFEYSFYILQ
jgi:hypothetical protein